VAEAEPLFREVGHAGNAKALNDLAWRLATRPESTFRDGTNAVELAQKAVAVTSRTNAMYLDSLAAAYAASGQYTNAVKAQQEAIALVQDEKQKREFGSRLSLYESGSAYCELGALAKQVGILLAAGKFADAEPLARRCLDIWEKQIPGDWRTFNAQSLLGAALLGQKKYAEAEPLLLSGYEGMKQRESQIPPIGEPRLREALQRLVQLYDATGRTNRAAEWKQKLAEFEKAETETQSATPPR
jgi:tetratricopeptide (TPR) repeat protein